MYTRLVQIQQRIQALEQLANEVKNLASRSVNDQSVVPELSEKGQRWYRGARELLAQHKSSALKELEGLYASGRFGGIDALVSSMYARAFSQYRDESDRSLLKARSLVLALEEELISRELPVVTQLSFAVVADEFDTAEQILSQSGGDEALIRAAGVVARVALERHLFTVAEARGITAAVNPPSKKKPVASDVTNSLVQANVITAVQRSHLESLFSVANNCAHPKEAVKFEDVQRLIRDGRAFTASIM